MQRKTHLSLAGAFLLCTALTACGGGASGSQRNKRGGLKVLTYLTSADSVAYTTVLNKVISDFNAIIEPEGYKIETETPGDSYYTSLANKFSSRNAPDIFMMEEGSYNGFSDLLLPLDEFLDSSEKLHRSDLWDLNNFYRNKNGKLTCLIKDFSPDFMLIYNKSVLNAYNEAHPGKQFTISETEPMSWSEYYEMCSTIQKEMGLEYGSSLGFEGVKHLHELVQSTGSSMYINDDTNVNKSDANVQAAFKLFCALQKDKAEEFPEYYNLNAFRAADGKQEGKAPGSYTSGSQTSEQQLFIQGRCFSIFNGLYAFASYDFYGINNFEYGIAPHPVMDKSKGAFGTTSAMVSHAISKTTKYKDIAWRFLEYYQTTGIEQFAKIAYNIPGNKTIAGSDNFLKNDNPKVEYLANYFYNFVNSGACTYTIYNSKISYDVIQTNFNSQLAKYYDGRLNFSTLLNEIDTAIHNSAIL